MSPHVPEVILDTFQVGQALEEDGKDHWCPVLLHLQVRLTRACFLCCMVAFGDTIGPPIAGQRVEFRDTPTALVRQILAPV